MVFGNVQRQTSCRVVPTQMGGFFQGRLKTRNKRDSDDESENEKG